MMLKRAFFFLAPSLIIHNPYCYVAKSCQRADPTIDHPASTLSCVCYILDHVRLHLAFQRRGIHCALSFYVSCVLLHSIQSDACTSRTRLMLLRQWYPVLLDAIPRAYISLSYIPCPWFKSIKVSCIKECCITSKYSYHILTPFMFSHRSS